MPTNKQAIIRYHALDRCFGNPGRRYFIEDLVEECSKAIYDATGSDSGVQRRQVLNDVKFMESEAGYAIPLERKKDGRRVYYHYSAPSFSIRGQSVNQGELEQIAETLTILSRFKGLPQFEWIDEARVRLQNSFDMGQPSNSKEIVSFEENPYLQGLNFFTDLFQAASQQRCLQMTYQGFKQPEPHTFNFHPWYLKQYNSRWFVLGYNEEYRGMSTLGIDRIQSIASTSRKYHPNTEIDFEDYFDDLIGVSWPEGAVVERVELQIAPTLWPYVQSKPIHGSQKVISKDAEGVVIELRVVINYELASVLAGFMAGVVVLEPEGMQGRFLKM